jgi:nitrogen fixation/metabolism regulation signal transduction histidine kinase
LIDIISHNEITQDAREDIISGARIISDRAQSLAEFIAQYRNLTQIKNPKLENISIQSLINPILPLFTSHHIILEGDTHLICALDSTQIKQVLINLLKNAVEAMQHPEAGNSQAAIGISISRIQTQQKNILRLDIIDSGCGIRHNQNLFIPFYTTKAQGSGIGLALSRQIIELHQGSLQIFNRESTKGCCARIELPLIQHQE